MSQARFGGVAAASHEVAKYEDLSGLALAVPPSMEIPRPARRRTSTYQIGAGLGVGAAGVGMLNAARTFTPAAANARVAAAREAARGPLQATATAANRVTGAAARDAAGSTSQSRRQLRRATDNYRTSLAASSAANNRAVAASNFASRTMGRRLRLAGVGAGLVVGGALMARGGARRRAEGD